MTGEKMYNAYREAHKHAARRRGLVNQPRWKDLKPWVKHVWEEAAGGIRDYS